MDSGLKLFKQPCSFIYLKRSLVPLIEVMLTSPQFAKLGPGIRDVTGHVLTSPFLRWPANSGWWIRIHGGTVLAVTHLKPYNTFKVH